MIIPTLLAPGELGIMRERYPLKSQIQVLSNLFIIDSGDHIEFVSVLVFEKLQSRNAQQTATFIFSPLFSRPDYQTL